MSGFLLLLCSFKIRAKSKRPKLSLGLTQPNRIQASSLSLLHFWHIAPLLNSATFVHQYWREKGMAGSLVLVRNKRRCRLPDRSGPSLCPLAFGLGSNRWCGSHRGCTAHAENACGALFHLSHFRGECYICITLFTVREVVNYKYKYA